MSRTEMPIIEMPTIEIPTIEEKKKSSIGTGENIMNILSEMRERYLNEGGDEENDPWAIIEQQRQFIDKITSPPFLIGVVVFNSIDGVAVSVGDSVSILMPFDEPLKVGEIVLINSQTRQIISRNTDIIPLGTIGLVRKVLSNQTVEIEETGGGIMEVQNNETNLGKIGVEVGDRVILDKSKTVLIKNLGRDRSYELSGLPSTEWDQIGGLVNAKQELREAIEYPMQYADLFKFYGKKHSRGIALYGPPGCGKTLLGKAAATAIAKIHGKEPVTSGFLHVSGPELLSKWVGQSETNIRALFDSARKHYREYKYPAIIFLDEAESILRRRGEGISSDVNNTIVPQFLAEMDGVDNEEPVIVMMATNRLDMIDPAAIRDGRVSRKIRIERPDKAQAFEIFKIHFSNVPLQDDTIEDMCGNSANDLFSSERTLFRLKLSDNSQKTVYLSDLVSGAMVASIVDRAISSALRRDIANIAQNRKKAKKGLRIDDIKDAITVVATEQKSSSVTDFVREIEELRGIKVESIEAVT